MPNHLTSRGVLENPASRFERLMYEPDPAETSPDSVPTCFFKDDTESIISSNDSLDVGFDKSVNPYRGCEHGCVYCYARPTHEYLGFSSGLDFETKIWVKEKAPLLLERELASPRWIPEPLAFCGVTDAYQPCERKFRLTRGCLEVALKFRNPVSIVTKSNIVTRDIDLLREFSAFNAVFVFITLTTLDKTLARKMEPRAPLPEIRLETVAALTEAGIPTGVLIAPVVPGLTDHEIPEILKSARQAGACRAGYSLLRLPYSVKSFFEGWLDFHFPDRKNKVLNQIRSIRGGKLNDSRFKVRMRGEGLFADQIHSVFKIIRRREGIPDGPIILNTDRFRRPGGSQLDLFQRGEDSPE